ncbi:hypothetical protein [Enterococcus sp.]|uniref:hypothetical protein n=1 Tax=Enterococcus sp. TaxID=35783 RepID=UPI002913FCF4|nr:hypothetical protein [Enterococcus sp.]MDU5336589.1 hypothetical protein [Enterococcus sp.]
MVDRIEDYRCTKYNERLRNTDRKKEDLRDKIVSGSKYDNMKNAVTNNEQYKEIFFEIYNTKCSYCGVDISLVSSDDFEVDHFICESFCKKHNIYAHDLDNCLWQDKGTYNCNAKVHNLASSVE